MSIAIIPMLVSMAIILFIPVLVGVYVYRDAKQRGMNAALWTLIAVITPTLIGFIIYLLVRGNYSDLKCPACTTPVTEQYVVCPKCGTKLRASCSNCGEAVEHDWTVCPKCASSLSEQNSNDYTPPIRKKDTALGKVLVLVILIPIVLMVLVGVFSFSGASSSMGSGQLSVNDYVDFPEIVEWLNKCDEDSSKTYALRYQSGYDDQKQTYYLIYQPSENGIDSVNVNNSSGLFGSNVEVRINESPGENPDEYELIYVSYFSNKFAGLKLFINGKKTDCEITEVDYSPALIDFYEKEQERAKP